MAKILVATPILDGKVVVEFHQTMLDLVKVFHLNGVQLDFLAKEGSELVKTRNFLAEYFYRNDYSHILFVDSDMGFKPPLLGKMLISEYPFVGAICPYRSINKGFVCSEHLLEGRGSFRRTKAIGTGILLLRREVFTKLREHYPLWTSESAYFDKNGLKGPVHQPFTQLVLPNGVILSEDLSFARRWTNLGEEIWVCVDETIKHVGMHSFTGNYLKDSI